MILIIMSLNWNMTFLKISVVCLSMQNKLTEAWLFNLVASIQMI